MIGWGASGFLLTQSESFSSRRRFLYSRAAEYDNSGSDAVFALDQLRLEKFEANANGAEFFALEKLQVAIGGNIGGRFCHVHVIDGVWLGWLNHEGDYSGPGGIRQF